MIPLLKNHPHGQRRIEVKVGEHSIKNIEEATFSIGVGDPGHLKLEIVGPEVDFTVGDYYIRSVKHSGWQSVEVKNIKTNKIVEGGQWLYFNAKEKVFTMECVETWPCDDMDTNEYRTYTIEANID